MKFEQVYGILVNHQKAINARVVLLAEATLREVYQCVIATRSRDCLELGTGHGATTCVIAAALEEIGGGTITTVDHRPDREHNISNGSPTRSPPCSQSGCCGRRMAHDG